MSVTSNRDINIQFTGDVEFQQTFSASASAVSPGDNGLTSLVSGNNTITVPTGAVAATIIKPTGNAVVLTLKGVNGDTGIALSLVDPDSISLSSVSSFVINASGTVTVRIIFS